MLQFASLPTASPPPHNLPKRTDSLLASKNALFATIDDDLRDARRVYSHGQEEDLKYALQKAMGRIEELSTLLKEAYTTQTDLQTELTLAKSNLQLALSNNEMLEDALKRDTSGRGQDVGWKRWSAREEENRRRISEEKEERPRSLDLERENHPQSSPTSPVTQPPAMTPTSTNGNSDHRFFRFRFGGSSSPRAPSPSNGAALTRSHSTVMPPSPLSAHPSPQPSHLASASLPSLVPAPSAKEFAEMKYKLEGLSKQLEEVRKELGQERTKRTSVSEEKERLEAELESLSQALFEEANKMVASERIKRAETEEELRQTLAEKTALKDALRLLERENGELRSVSSRSQSPVTIPHEMSRHARSASAVAVKSRRSSASSGRRSAVFLGNENAEEEGETHPSPEILSPQNHGSVESSEAPARSESPESLHSALPEPEPLHSTSEQDSNINHTQYASPAPSYPSFSPYPENGDSPWADVPSASPLPGQTSKFGVGVGADESGREAS